MNQSNIFYCDTPFQILMCINIRLSLLEKQDVSIIIADHINNAKILYERIKTLNIFDNVYYYEAFEIDKVGNILNNRKSKYRYFKNQLDNHIFDCRKYDYFWISDSLNSTDIIYSILKKNNSKIRLVFYEEGPISVLSDQQSFIYKNHNIKFLLKSFRDLFTPLKSVKYNFCKGFSSVTNMLSKKTRFPLFELPIISNQQLDCFIKLSNKIWNISNFDFSRYKCIFFEESFSLANIDSHDVMIVKDLLSVFSKEEVLIKLHPRTKINRFETFGVDIFDMYNVPWELIALNTRNNNIFLVSISSGSIIHPQLYWGIEQKTIALLKCKEYYFDELNKRYYKLYYDLCYNKKLAMLPDNILELKKELGENYESSCINTN